MTHSIELRIMPDDSPESPRTWDNLGTMVCWHRRYNLGDEHRYEDTLHMLTQLANYTAAAPMGGVEDWSIERIRALFERYYTILPVYMYDHSGISLSTSDYGDRWDSGQVGWIYVSLDDVRREYGVQRVTAKVRERVRKRLSGEVDVYGQYVNGDVYGFQLVEIDDHGHDVDVIDSCWGFYGDDFRANGLADCLPAEYRYLLDKPATYMNNGGAVYRMEAVA